MPGGGPNNSNPWKARMGRRLQAKPGDLEAAKCHTWAVLMEAFESIGEAEDSDDKRRWALAYSQLLGNFVRLYEIGEVEARLKVMETSVEGRLKALEDARGA
jgi:HAMP domain-containing protein